MSQINADTITSSLSMCFQMLGMGDRSFFLACFGETGQDIITNLSAPDALEVVSQCEAVIRQKVGEAHPDDLAAYQWMNFIKARLAIKRAEGRDGWQDPGLCSKEYLEDLYRDKVENDPTDYLDVAIFALMLHYRSDKRLYPDATNS